MNQKIVFKRISKSFSFDLKSQNSFDSSFFEFLVDNFYENILFLNSIEEELLSLIYKILKHDINKIDKISDLYDLLEKSTLGKIFDV